MCVREKERESVCVCVYRVCMFAKQRDLVCPVHTHQNNTHTHTHTHTFLTFGYKRLLLVRFTYIHRARTIWL